MLPGGFLSFYAGQAFGETLGAGFDKGFGAGFEQPGQVLYF
jgi:hypothetical protein